MTEQTMTTDQPTPRAVIIPETLWQGFTQWCGHHRVTLRRLPHSSDRTPRYEAHRRGTTPQAQSLARRGRPRENTLSNRELEVLQLMAEGLTNHEIARKLFLTEYTIKSHARRVFRKLGVSHRSAAVATALRHNLVE